MPPTQRDTGQKGRESLSYEERIQLAIKALDSGDCQNLTDAALAFDVARSTISKRRRGLKPKNAAHKSQQRLTDAAEEALERMIVGRLKVAILPGLKWLNSLLTVICSK